MQGFADGNIAVIGHDHQEEYISTAKKVPYKKEHYLKCLVWMANLPSRKALRTYILSFTALILHTSDRRAEIGFCRLVYFPKTILTLGIPILNISLIGEKRYLIIFFF